MRDYKDRNPGSISNSRIGTGLILLAAGLLLLASKLGAPIPGWIFTWPMILILVGFISGIKNNFQNPGAFILIILGSIFLFDQSFPFMNLQRFTLPLILIVVGALFVLRPIRCKKHFPPYTPKLNGPGVPGDPASPDAAEDISSEYLDLHAVFGGVKKKIISKNFKGGRIVSFMGGTDINLMQSDIQHPVVLEVHNLFAGTKIVIPSNWHLKNEISAIFGGVEDKRPLQSAIPEENKMIILRGSCVFGGIDISAY